MQGYFKMRRKVIQIADSTQLVSLPRKWALKQGIKKGDEVEVSESPKGLVISVANSKEQEKTLEINIDNASKFLRRLLFSPYIQGYTEIKVNYNDPLVFDLISNEVQLLMGYEIITQAANYCVIRSVATALDNDFDNILKRIFISTNMMLSELINSFENSDFDKMVNLKSLELTNNKLSYFCLRLLNIKGYNDTNNANSIYYTILCIEEIVDDLRDISVYVSKNKMNISKTVIGLAKKCLMYFDYVTNLFIKFDNEKLYEFNKGVKDLSREIKQSLQKSTKDQVVLSYFHKIIGKINHLSKEIYY